MLGPTRSRLQTLLLALACFGSSVSAQSGMETTAITGVTVLPMDADRTLADQTVLVRDGKIVALGTASRVAIPAGARRIDGRGKFLMPGLAEMHAHVPPGSPTQEQLADIMFLYVANGITTIRGMLGAPYQIALRGQLASGAMLGPRFFAAAPSLNGNSAPTPEAAVALVKSAVATGYDLMKIHPGFSRPTWDAAVAELKANRMTFGGHVPMAVGVVHAINSGISTIDHLDGYLEAAVRDSAIFAPGLTLGALIDAMDPSMLRGLAERAKAAGVWNVPTMYLWENFYNSETPESLAAREEMRYAAPQQVTGWMNQKRGRAPQDAAQQVTPERAAKYLRLRREMLRTLADVGAPILMGTDSPQMFNVPGFALHRELRVAHEAGLTNYQVLESGTRNVGRYVSEQLRQDGNFGTVAVGQWADLVLLDKNPLESLDHLTARAGVMVRGRWMPASELEAGLARIAAKYAAMR